MSFSTLLYFILAAEKKSISANLATIRQEFPLLKIPLVSKQAISKARHNTSSNACLSSVNFLVNYIIKKRSHWHQHLYCMMLWKVLQLIVNIEKYRLNERESAERHIDFFLNLHLSGKCIFLFA